MIPVWLKEKDYYQPEAGKDNAFIKKTIKKLALVLSNIQQDNKNDAVLGRLIPTKVGFLILLAAVIVISWTQSLLLLLAFFALLQLLLAFCPPKFIFKVLRLALGASLFTLLLLLPSMYFKPNGISNNLIMVTKVFLTLELVHIFSGITTWNQLTKILRHWQVPGIFIFTLDMTLKYIVILGNLLTDMLVALELRSIGRNNEKYQSIGGALGSTFVHSTEMSREVYEAMRCRGFTDDYRGL